MRAAVQGQDTSRPPFLAVLPSSSPSFARTASLCTSRWLSSCRSCAILESKLERSMPLWCRPTSPSSSPSVRCRSPSPWPCARRPWACSCCRTAPAGGGSGHPPCSHESACTCRSVVGAHGHLVAAEHKSGASSCGGSSSQIMLCQPSLMMRNGGVSAQCISCASSISSSTSTLPPPSSLAMATVVDGCWFGLWEEGRDRMEIGVSGWFQTISKSKKYEPIQTKSIHPRC